MYKMYINGEWVDSISGETYDLINPATEELISQVAYGDDRDAKKAIQVAHDVFPEWSQTTAKYRADILMKIYQLMMDKKEELAKIITEEMGKPFKEALGEVQNGAEHVAWSAEEGKRTYGQMIPSPTSDKRLLTIKQPVGPVAAITPWNFPLSMVTRKLSPALAAGCTAVFKPASQTPGSAIRFFELAEEAGLPKGVINLVMGKASKIGNEFVSNPLIRKITFTGSTEIGKKLMVGAAEQVKRVSMELGGHAPFIVFDDADLDAATTAATASKFRNNGQTCVCTNRIYVQSSIQEKFVSMLKEKVEKLVIGNGLDPETTIGPLIDEGGFNKAQEHVDDALAKGATLVTGGQRHDNKTGFFYKPTVLSHATDDMLITTEETFGPVAPIYTFETEEEVIKKANDTNYGLAAYFFTKDLNRSIRMYEALDYGMVGCNDIAVGTVQGPFGGVKESGMGREGGPGSLTDFMETKFVSIGM